MREEVSFLYAWIRVAIFGGVITAVVGMTREERGPGSDINMRNGAFYVILSAPHAGGVCMHGVGTLRCCSNDTMRV